MTEKRTEQYLGKRIKAARDHGVQFSYLDDLRMTVTTFPYDLRVYGLHRMLDPDRLEPIFRAALGPGVKPGRAEDGSLRGAVVSYRPERSCLFRYAVVREEELEPHCQTIFARLYRDDRGANVNKAMTGFSKRSADHAGRPSIAKPLGYDPSARILFQSAMGGVLLTDLTGHGSFLDSVAKLAISLFAIHQSPIRLDRTRSPDHELEWIELITNGLARVLPEIGERLNRIITQLRRTNPGAYLPPVPIHGDFSANQVLVEAGRVNVIDFDDASMGDPYADLGKFLARIEGHVEPTKRRQVAEVFGGAYESAQGHALAEDRLVWHQAVGFVRLAFISIARLKAGWLSQAKERLAQAEVLLGR